VLLRLPFRRRLPYAGRLPLPGVRGRRSRQVRPAAGGQQADQVAAAEHTGDHAHRQLLANVILVLEDGVPRRVVLKDIAEEIAVMDPAADLSPEVERIRADVPDELKTLSLFTDVFDCFLRFLNAILSDEGVMTQDEFWSAVAGCVAGYQASVPRLAGAFARHDLFAGRFARSCLNRLQLRDNQQMVDLQDPAGALQLVGTLENPIARFAPGRS
jgi:siderophore synthetase component